MLEIDLKPVRFLTNSDGLIAFSINNFIFFQNFSAEISVQSFTPLPRNELGLNSAAAK